MDFLFTTRKQEGETDRVFEPYLPAESDDYAVRKIRSFWESPLSLPLAGIIFFFVGFMTIKLDAGIVDFLRIVSIDTGDYTAIGKLGAASLGLGAVMTLRGVKNLKRYLPTFKRHLTRQ